MLETRDAGEDGAHDQLRSQALAALDRREFGKAEKLLDWAYAEARRSADPVLLERAYCNRSMVANLRCETTRFAPEPRRIVTESDDPESRCLAAYDLANLFGDQGSYRKAPLYAELSLQEEFFPGIPTVANALLAHRTHGAFSWLA